MFFFNGSKKKKEPVSPASTPPPPPSPSRASTSSAPSPKKTTRKSTSKSLPTRRKSSHQRGESSNGHPLNLPEDLRRLSALSAMSNNHSPSQPNGDSHAESNDHVDAVNMAETETPGAFPTMNGDAKVNGDGHVSGEDKDVSDAESAPPPVIPPVDPEACKAAGNKLYKAGQYAKAIEEYTKAINASPQTATYLSNRAAAYMSDLRYTQALADCKLADELDPQNPKILHRLAKVYTTLGQPTEALEVYDRITNPPATAKDRSPAQSMQTHIQQAEQNLQSSTSGSMVLHALDQAEKQLGFAVPAPRKWKLMRGEAQLKICTVNSLGEAQNIAMSLLRNNSADPEALVLRGRALYASGENEKAITHFRQALNCDPDFKDAVTYLRMVQKLDRMKEEGNEHFKRGRYPQAVETYTKALQVDSGNKGTNSKLLNNRAMCYSRQKKWTLAIEDCDKAIQLDPSYTKAKKTRAKALGEGGDWEEAVRAYKAIQESSPEEPGIAKEIRNAELELKKSKRKDYYKILELDKDCSETDIKKSYRRLAVKHHPDKNPDDPEAEGRFKDLQEAHETLIDPQKRERFDSGVDLVDPHEGFGGGGGFGGFGGMGGGGGMNIPPEVIFQMMNGMGGGRGGGGNPFGGGGGFQFG